MEFTRKAEYAIRILVDLAQARQREGYTVSRAIAARQGIPPKLIPQLVAALIKAGWVEGMRGAGGGVRLAVDPAQITVTEVIELFEGPIALNPCLVGEGVCGRERACPLHGVWARAQAAMLQVLSGTTIADLVRAKEVLTRRPGETL